jgi:hypothetical protein
VTPADISAELSLPATAPVRPFGESSRPATAYGGGVHLVAWQSSGYGPHAVRLRASDAAAVDPVQFALSAAYAPCGPISGPPAVAFAGSHFLVAWSSNQRVCAVRVPAMGDVGPLAPIVLSDAGDPSLAAAASDGSNFLVVWADWRSSDGQPFGTRRLYRARIRAADGTVLDPGGIRLTSTIADQRYPAVTFDGSNFLVMWRDRRVPAGLYGTRIRASDGQALDGDGFAVQATNLDDARPALAFDGSNHLAVWSDHSRILGVRVRASDRAVLDVNPVTLATLRVVFDFAEPVISHDGSTFVLLWRDLVPGAAEGLRARRLSGALAPVGDVLPIADTAAQGWKEVSTQALSFGEGKHLAVWTQMDHLAPAGNHYYPLRQVDLMRTMLDAGGNLAAPKDLVARAAPLQDKPAASFDGRYHLLSWQEWDGSKFDIRMLRLRDSDRTLVDPQPRVLFSTTEDSQFYPKSASNGSVHLVVWGDRLKLRAARVRGEDGTVLDAQPLILPGSPGLWSPSSPRWAVASDGSDFLVAWVQGGVPDDPAKVLGTRVRASDGAVLDTVARSLVDAPADPYSVNLSFVGSHYLLVWTDSSTRFGPMGVYARRLGTDGAPLATRLTLAEPSASALDGPLQSNVIGAGDVALVFWDMSGERTTRGRRVRVSDGTVLDSSDLTITTAALNTRRDYGRMVAGHDDEHFLFLWPSTAEQLPAVRFGRVTFGGQVLDPSSVLVTVPDLWGSYDPAISVGTGGVLSSYVRYASGPSLSADRLHWRWLGRAPPPPDAAPPSDVAPDFAPDAGLPPDAPGMPPIDAAVPVDAPSPPPVDAPPPPPVDAPGPQDDAASPPVDAPAPMVDGSADMLDAAAEDRPQGTVDTPGAESPSDGVVADATRDADASRDVDGGRPREEEPGCSCNVGARGNGRGGIGLLIAVAALCLRRRRSRIGEGAAGAVRPT